MTYTLLILMVVVPLAVWRVSNLLSDTDQSGPFNILDWIRIKAGVKYNELSIPYAKKGSIADMLLCVYCNSIWIGLLFALLILCDQIVTIIVSLPLALSAVAILLEEWRIRKE